MTTRPPAARPKPDTGSAPGVSSTQIPRKPKARFNLRVKLLIVALLLCTLPLIVASIILPLNMEETLKKTGHDHLIQVARDLVSLTQRELEQNIETVSSIASIEPLVDAVHRQNAGTLDQAALDRTNRQLKALLQQLGGRNQGVFMSNAGGTLFAGVVKTGETSQYIALDINDRAYFTQVRSTLKPAISDPLLSKVGNTPIIVIAVPILDAKGAFAGMLGLSIEIAYFSEVISTQKIGETGYPFAIDRFGMIFAHPDHKRVMTLDLSKLPTAEYLVKRMMRGETGVEEYTSSKGAKKLAAFAPVPMAGWSVAASIETSEFAAPALSLRKLIFAMIGACVVLAILLATTFAIGLERLKLAMAETRRNEAELDVIHDNAPTMMLLLDREFRVRRANRAARLFTDHPEDLVVGLKRGVFLGCIHARDDERGCGFGPSCTSCQLHQSETDTSASGNHHTQIETRLNLLRGGTPSEYILRVSTASIEIDKDPMVLVCLEDMTEQKRAQERIQEQAALLDVTRDAIYVLDSDNLIVFWNRGAELIYGWTATEAIGCKLSDLFGDYFKAEIFQEAKAALWAHGTWAEELQQPNRAGQIRTMQCRATLIRDLAGNPRSILSVNTDVTEAREVEAQFLRAQRMDSLGELASGVAHDLNNVLSPILMAVELLRPVAQEPDDCETINLIDESAKRGADVVKQLLLFGRGSNGPRTLVKVSKVLAELMRIAQGTFPKNIIITAEISTELKQVLADPTQLYQVFLNLFVNARDVLPEGGLLGLKATNIDLDAAFVKMQPGAKPGSHIVVAVKDSGTGIPTPILDKIFDPFFTTKAEGRGTGLGLSTVLGIVRSHGGFITVKTQLGVGTEFAVYLPATAPTKTKDDKGDNAGPLNGNGELILVVDDESSIRDVLRRNLESANYRVLQARDGKEGLQLWHTHGQEIQAIVTDLVMPIMDGLQTIREIRQGNTAVPIIALSGADNWRVKLQESELENVAFLAKPFDTTTLLAALSSALGSAMGSCRVLYETRASR